MKKLLFFAITALVLLQTVASQSDVSQVVVPKRVYVGDTAELRYAFRSGVDFFSDLPSDQAERELIFSSFPFEPENDDFTLNKAVLQRSGLTYTLVFTFIPWRPGSIDIPPVDLTAAVYGNSSAPYFINPEAFEVTSILDKAGDSAQRPPAAPLLIPGTAYAVYAAAVLAFILLIVLVRLALNWNGIMQMINRHIVRRNYARSAKNALRSLKKLSRKSGKGKIEDTDFCLELQHIMRRYLSVRFGRRFDVLTASQIAPVFEDIMCGMMSEEKYGQVENLAGLFLRTDYIRFAHDSADSKRFPAEDFAAELQEGEGRQLIERARTVIFTFEGVEKNA